jgi:hypothetical protein
LTIWRAVSELAAEVHLKFFSESSGRAILDVFWREYIFNFGFSIFFFLFNIYLLGFGVNERPLGLIGSCMAGGSLLGAVPAGIFAERLGRGC